MVVDTKIRNSYSALKLSGKHETRTNKRRESDDRLDKFKPSLYCSHNPLTIAAFIGVSGLAVVAVAASSWLAIAVDFLKLLRG